VQGKGEETNAVGVFSKAFVGGNESRRPTISFVECERRSFAHIDERRGGLDRGVWRGWEHGSTWGKW
jgi:hypothetical protein